MLTLVGLGLLQGVTDSVRDAIRSADRVYLERFTSPVDEDTVSALRDLSGGRLLEARRWQVEDGAAILREAGEGSVVLVSYGDPLTATTHAELAARAASGGIAVRVIHGASAVTAVPGECGLHHYKVGRISTVMADPKATATPYGVVCQNLVLGCHTILLLEYDREGGSFLRPQDALLLLLEEGRSRGTGEITPDTYAVVASRIGSPDPAVVAGRISGLLAEKYGGPPHSIVVPGGLHFTESDALRALARCVDEPEGNLLGSRSAEMISKYVPMVDRSIRAEEARGAPGTESLLENARCYARDAEQFLAEGRDELAVLSIGYADGLVDALRVMRGDPADLGENANT